MQKKKSYWREKCRGTVHNIKNKNNKWARNTATSFPSSPIFPERFRNWIQLRYSDESVRPFLTFDYSVSVSDRHWFSVSRSIVELPHAALIAVCRFLQLSVGSSGAPWDVTEKLRYAPLGTQQSNFRRWKIDTHRFRSQRRNRSCFIFRSQALTTSDFENIILYLDIRLHILRLSHS